MPDDRFLHRRCLQSVKVAGLTDFEYRVWTTYVLAADDFGVMRFSSATLRSANDAFEKKPAKVLERALDRLDAIGLVRTFHHQGKVFCYQHDWQEYQHIKNPRASVQPLPPLDAIEGCEEETRELLKNRLEFTGESPADGCTDAALVQQHRSNIASRARAPERLTATGDRLTANGSEIRERFDRFWLEYPRKVGKGAAWRVWVKLRPDAALLATMLAALEWQRHQPQWVKDGGQFIPHPSTWLNQGRWQDEPQTAPNLSEKTTNNLRAIYGSN